MKHLRSRRRPRVTSRLRAIERLETRRLFSTDLSQDLFNSDSESAPVVGLSQLVGDLQFERKGILGSGIASVEGFMPAITGAQFSSDVSFVASADTKTSFVVTPIVRTAILTVSILRPDATVAAGPFVASAPGGVVVIPPLSLAEGSYRLVVFSTVATTIALEAARNAVIESQVGDTTGARKLRIDSSYQDFGGSGVYGVVGKASGPLILSKVNDPAAFVDIAGRGTRLDIGDEDEATITTTVGNSLFPAGNVTVANNGAILAAPAYNLDHENLPLSGLSNTFPTALMPFWDDLDGGRGGVFWLEENIDGVPTLIVQWDGRPHWPSFGAVTFQLQLYASGPVLARFVYRDVVFDGTSFDFGGSATIGVVSGQRRSQFGFNAPVLSNDDVIEIRDRKDIDVDEYEFRGTAGQAVDIAFDALGRAVGNDAVVRLFRGATLLATATSNPIANGLNVANYDVGIVGFTLPENGIYTVRVATRVSTLSDFRYYLSVTRNTALDTENSNFDPYPARSIDAVPGAIMGFLNSADEVDVGFLRLNAGRSVRLVLTRVGDNSGYSPANTLAPNVVVVGPNLSTVARTSTFNANGEMVLDVVATESGRHRIFVKRIRGLGEYVLKVVPGVATAAPALAQEASGNNAAGSVAPEVRRQLASPLDPLLDMNGDGELSPIDALLVINRLNQRALKRDAVSATVPRDSEEEQATDLYFDINGDGLLSPLDALHVINRLNKRRV